MQNPDTIHLIHYLHARLQPVLDEYPDRRAKFNGSSILLQVGERFFFISAAHVFAAPADGGVLHVVGDSRNLRLRLNDVVGGTDASSPNPGEGTIDVAFLEVTAAEVERLGGAAALQMNEVDVDESLRPKGAYLAIGYPGSKTSIDQRKGIVRVKPFAFHTGRAEPEIYRTFGHSPNTHLVLKYDRDSVTWHDEVERKGPLPHGMSGGGVWCVRNTAPASPGPADAKLVAIMIQYHAKDQVIVATRIALLLEGIRVRFPELSPLIPRTAAIKLNVGRG